MSKTIKIAFLTTDAREPCRTYNQSAPSFGTAPEAVLKGLSGFPELEIHVVSCLQQPVCSPKKLADNIFYHSLHVPRNGWHRTCYLGCIRAVRRCLRSLQPDLVHGQGTERDCAITSLYSGFPNVITIHGNMREMERLEKPRIATADWFAARLESLILPRTAGVFCNSRFTEQLVSPKARKTWVVPNPLREEFFRLPKSAGPKRGKCVLVNVGVICPNKRQLELLELVQRLRKRGLVFEMRFIGGASEGSPYVKEFLRRLREAGADGYASHENPVEPAKLARCFDEASAMVHFSRTESFGLVVAEALARDLRVFSARSGGVADIASGVEGAQLVDDLAELEEVLAAWIGAGFPPARSSRELMLERYNPSVIARAHAEIYREVLAAS